MPLITGSIYLFGQLLSFALPVSLLLTFATFFYRQARKLPNDSAPASSAAAPAASAAATPASAPAPAPAPATTEPSAQPTRPYSDL